MEEIRAFVCLELPSDIREKIARTSEQIRSASIKPVKPDQMHITLFFFEKASRDQITGIERAIGRITRSQFNIEVGGVDTFNYERPSVIFTKVNAGAEIAHLYGELLPSMEKTGFTTKGRPFSPHVTIARCRNPDKESTEKISAFLKDNNGTIFGRFRCKAIALKQSTLTEAGPIYKTLLSSDLAP